MHIPFTEHEIKVPREGKDYRLAIFQPHSLCLAINEERPDLATFYAVNVGAGDGIACNDPVYPLFAAGYGGLAIEGEKNPQLELNLPSATITKLDGTYVSPENIGIILKRANCPPSPDFLKIDIDGFDAPILNTILELEYRPKVLQVEVNPEFPPPIEFFVQYDPEYRVHDKRNRIGGFYGVSMAYVVNTAQRYGYALAQIDFVSDWTHDVTLFHTSFSDIVSTMIPPAIQQQSCREAFLAHPPGHSHFNEYGVDSFAWRHREDYSRLVADIWDACLYASARKHGGRCIPFYLSISPHSLLSGKSGDWSDHKMQNQFRSLLKGKMLHWLGK